MLAMLSGMKAETAKDREANEARFAAIGMFASPICLLSLTAQQRLPKAFARLHRQVTSHRQKILRRMMPRLARRRRGSKQRAKRPMTSHTHLRTMDHRKPRVTQLRRQSQTKLQLKLMLATAKFLATLTKNPTYEGFQLRTARHGTWYRY